MLDDFYISDTDGDNKIIFNPPPIDWSPEPEIKSDEEMVICPGSWDDSGNELPPLYIPHVSPSDETGAELYVSGSGIEPADRTLLKNKFKAGIEQLYYNGESKITYTVYITPMPDFKFIPGTDKCLYTIKMKVK